ncbi:hypothetical protein DLAC_02463 [Tieghemostelium lacteum]|uniref:Uncharacterized protein n=1 Tax=Tieghemostelium lacteum TaxID=361077 RepID=A0A152A2I2_TIELA|nr:hypothetical protein DLAC_02463 [Tieghemostelium lacteum]|eukprot:KYR00462.1 hypothetical protein DLAC_02463 [Tieghemostelium lacteum]
MTLNKDNLLTIQIGNYANFIASHYWNIQNQNYETTIKKENEDFEINPECLYRTIHNFERASEPVYKPRALIFDFKSNLGSLNSDGRIHRGTAHQTQEEQVKNNSDEGISTFIQKPLGKPINPLDKAVDNSLCGFEYWSDYLYGDYSKNSIVEIPDSFNSIPNQSTLCYDDGKELLSHSWQLEELYQDYLRKMFEECDCISGFQIFCDSSDLWGGITSMVMDHLSDEFTSKPIITFSSVAYQEHQSNESIYNQSMSLLELSKSSRIYIPMYLDDTFASKYNPLFSKTNKFHSAAVFASSIDCATLGYRSNYLDSLESFCYQLSTQPSTNLISLASSFGSDFQNKFGFGFEKRTNEPVFPSHTLSEHPLMSHFIPGFHYLPKYGSYSENVTIRGDLYSGESGYDKVYSMVNQYLSSKERVLNRKIYNISQPFEMKKNQFPQFLINNHSNNNQSNSILTQLQNTPSIHPYLNNLSTSFKSLLQDKSKLTRLSNDTIEESLESLLHIADSYLEK